MVEYPTTWSIANQLAGCFEQRTLGCQQRAVDRVAERLQRLLDREPAEVVDLEARPEAALNRVHQQVADDLVAPASVDVGRAARRAPEPAAHPRLLPDLAQRGLL